MRPDHYQSAEKKLEDFLKRGSLKPIAIEEVLASFEHPNESIHFILSLYKKAGDLIQQDQSTQQYLIDRCMELNKKSHNLSDHDPLTGLFNKKAFKERFAYDLKSAERHQQELSLLMFDLDHFKSINDSYGHPFGDRVLFQLAEVIRVHSRPEDYVGRYGGEEFIAAFLSCNPQNAKLIASRIHTEVGCMNFLGLDQPITLTGGISTFPWDGTNIDDLILKADSALYYGKESGRNRIITYTPNIPLIKPE